MSDKLSPVPAHLNLEGHFCNTAGTLAPRGRCPDGCDHADHYSNDGHPECDDPPGFMVVDHPDAEVSDATQ